MPNYTFGFEAEYQINVQEIARAMYDAGHTYDTSLHNYTCDCIGCTVSEYDPDAGEQVYDSDNIYNLRIKNDSSCGGELISKVWDTPNDSRLHKLWSDIEEAAVALNTEPSLTAGFHVHVSREHLTLPQRGRLVLAFTGWEQALLQLGSGRWPSNRNWNGLLSDNLRYTFDAILSSGVFGERDITLPKFGQILNCLRNTDDENLKRMTYRKIAREHQHIDRHTSMAFSERHPTMEFRLWNSTRAAWRMELWCRLSLLMADPRFVSLMLDEWTPTVSVYDFICLIEKYDSADNSRTLELADRQFRYLLNCDTLNVTQSTPFSMA